MPRWTGAQDTKHRSVSQLQSYDRCPYAYYLKRVQEPPAPARPAAWLPMGTALHEAVEAVEKDGLDLEEALVVAEAAYVSGVNDLCEAEPHWERWFASGRYEGASDVERRFQLLRSHLERYFTYREQSNDVIWIDPDGTPGIELEFDIDLDGVRVMGYIDQILHSRTNAKGRDVLHVRDVKTGAAPDNDLQLGVYKVALEESYDVVVPSGDFLLTKTGSASFPYDLGDYTLEEMTARFRALEDNVQAGNFEPKPSPSVCRRCDVAASCPYAE